MREAQTSVLDVTKGEDDISWRRIRSARHLAAQTEKGSTFEHIEMKALSKTRVPKNRWMNGFASFAKPNRLPSNGGPLIPGDPEREAEAIRSKEGIPLLKPVVDDLLEIAEKTAIPFEISRLT